MNNYIFMNAPQNKNDLDILIRKLEQTVASSILRKTKSESFEVTANSVGYSAGKVTGSKIDRIC
ncbi:MAG: hypothetical protein WBK46_14130 [Ruminococcus flavefaciens]